MKSNIADVTDGNIITITVDTTEKTDQVIYHTARRIAEKNDRLGKDTYVSVNGFDIYCDQDVHDMLVTVYDEMKLCGLM